ncbi:hypothetical protein ZWY2020_029952 [Hordeum vulgare]|nr:hypothetical protein ZWY2020_029952 [Hordeum vulgare]
MHIRVYDSEGDNSSGSMYWFAGLIGRHLFLYDDGNLSPDFGCFSLDIKTFQIERVCASKTWISSPRAYIIIVTTTSSKWYQGMRWEGDAGTTASARTRR